MNTQPHDAGRPSPDSPAAWFGLASVAAAVVLVVLGAEVALHRLAPMPRQDLEVDDGVRAFEQGNPELLVLGSSHAGSYLPLVTRLGAERLAVITEEGAPSRPSTGCWRTGSGGPSKRSGPTGLTCGTACGTPCS